MISKDWKKEILTIPNLLSLFRLVLIPVYVVIYMNARAWEEHLLAGGILAVSCLTDLIDGKIARHFNMISTVGKVLDPLADKATQFTMIICLLVRYPVLWAMVLLFIAKEGFQLIAAFLALHKGQMLNGALFSGKLSTTVLFISLIALVVLPNLEYWTVCAITAIDCIFLAVAFISYAKAYYTHTSMIPVPVEPDTHS